MSPHSHRSQHQSAASKSLKNPEAELRSHDREKTSKSWLQVAQPTRDLKRPFISEMNELGVATLARGGSTRENQTNECNIVSRHRRESVELQSCCFTSGIFFTPTGQVGWKGWTQCLLSSRYASLGGIGVYARDSLTLTANLEYSLDNDHSKLAYFEKCSHNVGFKGEAILYRCTRVNHFHKT